VEAGACGRPLSGAPWTPRGCRRGRYGRPARGSGAARRRRPTCSVETIKAGNQRRRAERRQTHTTFMYTLSYMARCSECRDQIRRLTDWISGGPQRRQRTTGRNAERQPWWRPWAGVGTHPLSARRTVAHQLPQWLCMCKWLCMCRTEAQLRLGQRGGGRIVCLPLCPKGLWMRDPGWPIAPQVADEPAIGTSCSYDYFPSSGKSGTIVYLGRGEWSSIV